MTSELKRYSDLKRTKFYFPQDFTIQENKEYKELTVALIKKQNEIEIIKKETYPLILLQSINKEIKTLDDLAQNEISTSLFSFSKYVGAQEVFAILFKKIASTILFFGASKANISEEVVAESCKIIQEDYSEFTIEEINYVLKEAKRGKYGEIYGNIGGSVVLGWFEKYKTSKEDFFVLKNENKHLANKQTGESMLDELNKQRDLRIKRAEAEANFNSKTKK